MTCVLFLLCTWLVTSCGDTGAGPAGTPVAGPQPSPKPAFTGLAVPVTIAAPAGPPTPAGAELRNDARSGLRTLTILHTNDTRGYIDPCG
jgi:hypothetical protein